MLVQIKQIMLQGKFLQEYIFKSTLINVILSLIPINLFNVTEVYQHVRKRVSLMFFIIYVNVNVKYLDLKLTENWLKLITFNDILLHYYNIIILISSWRKKKVYPNKWNTISQWHLSSTGKFEFVQRKIISVFVVV